MLDVRPGDRLLMASDGLTGVVPDKDLVHILGNGRRPAACGCHAERLGARQRFEGQCDLPDHPRRRPPRTLARPAPRESAGATKHAGSAARPQDSAGRSPRNRAVSQSDACFAGT